MNIGTCFQLRLLPASTHTEIGTRPKHTYKCRVSSALIRSSGAYVKAGKGSRNQEMEIHKQQCGSLYPALYPKIFDVGSITPNTDVRVKHVLIGSITPKAGTISAFNPRDMLDDLRCCLTCI